MNMFKNGTKKGLKRTASLVTAVLVIVSLSAMVFADVPKFNPFATLAELTKKTEAEIKTLHESKPLGVIAKEAGVLEAFQAKMLEGKKAHIAQAVKEGKLTQAQADKILADMATRIATCDGNPSGLGKIGRGHGMGEGKGLGMGEGKGLGKGMGMGKGKGRGPGN